MVLKDTFRPVLELSEWIESGGEARAGLPHATLMPLQASVINFRSSAAQLAHGLGDLSAFWGDGPGDNAFAAAVPQFILILDSLGTTAHVADAHASIMVTSASETLGAIERATNANRTLLANLQVQRAESDARLQREQAKVRAARQELEGDKGFLNGFLTGITLGIHNPIKANLDAANAAIASIMAEDVQRKMRAIQADTARRELAAAVNGVNRISNASQHVADFKNDLLEVSSSISTAYRTLNRSEDAASIQRMNKLLARARKQIEKLISWNAAFQPFA